MTGCKVARVGQLVKGFARKETHMRRAIVLAMLAASLTLGPGGAYAFPNGPCAPTAAQSTAKVQLFLLALSAATGYW